MTRREAAIVAFAAATLVVAVVILLGYTPFRRQADSRLPVLNGPPAPQASPASPTIPSPSPSPGAPTPSPSAPTPGRQPAPNMAMTRVELGEDETEDEPASAELAGLLPGDPRVPIPSPVAPALSSPPPLIP